MTWSTLPSQSQRADTGPITKENEQAQAAADVNLKSREDANENLERNDLELEDIIMESSKTTVSLVEVRLSSNLNLKLSPLTLLLINSPRYPEVRVKCRWPHRSRRNRKPDSWVKRPNY